MADINNSNASTATITLTWGTVYQRIDGFGAFAGRAVPFFKSRYRDTFLEKLWGDSGLRLNMIRAEVLHTYPFDATSGVVTIKPAGVSIDEPLDSPAFEALTRDQVEHLAQLWILKKAKERFDVSIPFASAWTPPLYMKTNPNSKSAQKFNGLDFRRHSTDFARYLAGFAKSHQDEGIDLYAISPCNEPENIFSEYQESFWLPRNLGEFITKNLRKALNEKGLGDTKIIASENAAWKVAKRFLFWRVPVVSPGPGGMDKSNVDIYAGHGYVPPTELIASKLPFGHHLVGLNQSPSKWPYDTGNKPVWVTEASDDGGTYDETMKGGLRLAISMHKFLTECDVNAYVYWLGMLDFKNNESLLGTNKDETIAHPKIYDVMGQFSRYVRAGYRRFSSTVANNSTLQVSAYKDPTTGKFAMVVINPGPVGVRSTIKLSGFTAGSLIPYLTSDESDASRGHWPQGAAVDPQTDGSYVVTVPPLSVVTFTGTAT